MNMLIWAIQVAGLNRAKIRDVLAYRTEPWPGVTGDIPFSAAWTTPARCSWPSTKAASGSTTRGRTSACPNCSRRCRSERLNPSSP